MAIMLFLHERLVFLSYGRCAGFRAMAGIFRIFTRSFPLFCSVRSDFCSLRSGFCSVRSACFFVPPLKNAPEKSFGSAVQIVTPGRGKGKDGTSKSCCRHKGNVKRSAVARKFYEGLYGRTVMPEIFARGLIWLLNHVDWRLAYWRVSA